MFAPHPASAPSTLFTPTLMVAGIREGETCGCAIRVDRRCDGATVAGWGVALNVAWISLWFQRLARLCDAATLKAPARMRMCERARARKATLRRTRRTVALISNSLKYKDNYCDNRCDVFPAASHKGLSLTAVETLKSLKPIKYRRFKR